MFRATLRTTANVTSALGAAVATLAALTMLALVAENVVPTLVVIPVLAVIALRLNAWLTSRQRSPRESSRQHNIGDRVEIYTEDPARPGRHTWQAGTVVAVERAAIPNQGYDYTVEMDRGGVYVERMDTFNPDLRAVA